MFLINLIFSFVLVWANPAEENLIAVGQGIASPSVTTLINLGRGYTPQNPAGVMYQGGLRLSGQFAKNGESDTGVEVGYSGSTVGFAAGMFQPGCDNCDAAIAAALGFSLGKHVWSGLRYEDESLYGLGFLFNPEGQHRVGLNLEYDEIQGVENDRYNIGLGYAYVDKKNTFAVDYSLQELENPNASNDIQILSPSYSRREGKLAVSFGYEVRQGDTAENNDRFWMGAGFRGRKAHIGVYAVYRRELLVTISGIF